MKYAQFCLAVAKTNSILLPSEFQKRNENLFYKGEWIESNLLGNIHSYVEEFKLPTSANFQKILAGLENNAVSFLENFAGDFSFVYAPDTDGSLVAARDHVGVFPLFYYDDDNYFILSNDQRSIIEIPGIDLSSNLQWKGDFVTSWHEDAASTFYEKIMKVPPAHILRYNNGKINLEKYWDLHPSKGEVQKTDDEYIFEFKTLLVQAIESRIPEGVNIGSEVSGGIDCTSVAAIAKNYLDRNNRTLYTYGHSAFDYQRFPSERGAIEVYLETLKPFKHTFVPEKMLGMRAVAECAFRLRNGIPHDHFTLFSAEIVEKASQDEVKIIFSGLGGDHGASYKGTGTIIKDLIKQRHWKKAFKELRLIHKRRFKAVFYFFSYFLQTNFGLPLKAIDYSAVDKGRETSLERLTKIFPELRDYPSKKERKKEKYQSVQESVKDRLLLVANSLRCEASTIAANERGVLYRYPLLDIRLAQFMVTLPSHLFYQNGVNRYIFRNVIKDFVPEKIAFQPKPHAQMYGWILEAYKHDYVNQLEYTIVPEDEEMKLYIEFWKHRDQMCYAGDRFKNIL
jgi:asparagine synthase (glutamine-hydrolysing)